MKLHSYSKIYSLGHPALANLFSVPVFAEEKVDGSQISFGILDGELQARSKGAEIVIGAPDKMFARAVAVIKELEPFLYAGWIYRGEYLRTPKHNTLAYSRVPRKHIVLFDVEAAPYHFLSPDAKREEAARLGLEVVPQLSSDGIPWRQDLIDLALQAESFLGGQSIEGLVFKPLHYDLYDKGSKVLMGKFVHEDFKEQNSKAHRAANPTSGDILERLGQAYRTEARWEKAVQHLRDSGQLEGSPRDIGPLIKEVQRDLREEEEEAIKRALWRWAWQAVERKSVAGLAEWYKQRLLDAQSL